MKDDERIRAWLATAIVVADTVLLVNMMTNGAVFGAVSRAWARVLERRRRELELRRDAAHVVFEAMEACRDAAQS